MAKYKVKYTRTVYDTYEAIVEAESEDYAFGVVWDTKYGDHSEVLSEVLTETNTDYVEIHSISKEGD